MKNYSIIVFILLAGVTALAGMTFEDIDVWVGQGQNEAALVVDWNDGESELVKVWGYRWDGTATGEDMLMAVCQADTQLYVMGVYDQGLDGIGFGGIGYDKDVDGFDITKTDSDSDFDSNGYMQVAEDVEFDGWTADDADDIWSSGWFSDGFWGYYGIDTGNTWQYPGAGASARELQNGSWDGWSWGDAASGWDGGVPSVAVQVPEPMTLLLLGAGAFLGYGKK
ncbi:MAG: PEP-CTERM sorting domain-containing protein [Planctomycetota bacterium]|jgi:hypothetical protein